jgi:hypothetical protein
MALVAAGLLNKQVAGELAITGRAIKLHRAHIRQRMHAESLADLVRLAEKFGAVVRRWNGLGKTLAISTVGRCCRNAARLHRLSLGNAMTQPSDRSSAFEHFQKYCSHAVVKGWESGLFGFGLRFGSVTGR